MILGRHRAIFEEMVEALEVARVVVASHTQSVPAKNGKITRPAARYPKELKQIESALKRSKE